MKVDVYNQKGEVTGSTVLPKEIFQVQMNADLVHQVAISQNRSEVRGGGRKPWRQKGTGRARHGSTRSPIWVGGGVSGGPRNDINYSRIIPAKMRRKALFMVLSEKAKNNQVVILENMEVETPKTSVMASLIKKLPVKNESRLVVSENANKKVFLAARNIAKTGVSEARNLNVADMLNYKYVVISKEGIKDIEKTFIVK